MRTLTHYGCLAEKHWRQFCPRLVADLEATGRLEAMLLEAEEKTDAELDALRRQLIQRGSTAQQAREAAWELVRERYIFLPPES